MENNFEISNITKSFGRKKVLDDVSLSIPYGSIVGILGLNGEGKSTIFNIIAGFLDYSGEISKHKPCDISYMPTEPIIRNSFSIKEAIAFYNDFMPGFNKAEAIAEVNKLGLDIKKPLGKLSMGQRRIVMFILSMACDAKYIC
jgi:ABC-2 type transport system ATP-binding protein